MRVPYLGHSRRRERQCYPNGQKSKIPFGCIVNFVAPMIMSVPGGIIYAISLRS